MSSEVRYTPYHPKWYRRPVSVWWWLESWRYTRFVLRELTSVPVAAFALILFWEVSALADGPEAHARFLARLESPVFLVVGVLIFGGVLFHALTWFHAAPKAMDVRMGGKRVSGGAIVAGNYVGWLVVSALVAWIWLGG